jgi:hypothetical protein
MRIVLRRRSGPVSTAIVVLAFVLVLGLWIWAGTHAPPAEGMELRARCQHLPLLVGVESSGGSTRPSRRQATYLCLPDYLRQRMQFSVITQGDAPVKVVLTPTNKPMIFVGVLVLMGAFFVYVRRSTRATKTG